MRPGKKKKYQYMRPGKKNYINQMRQNIKSIVQIKNTAYQEGIKDKTKTVQVKTNA